MIKAIVLIIITLFVPPLGVFLVAGCGVDFIINILLTCLGYFPGHIHAFYLEYIYFKRRSEYRSSTGTSFAPTHAPGVYSEKVQWGGHHHRHRRYHTREHYSSGGRDGVQPLGSVAQQGQVDGVYANQGGGQVSGTYANTNNNTNVNTGVVKEEPVPAPATLANGAVAHPGGVNANGAFGVPPPPAKAQYGTV